MQVEIREFVLWLHVIFEGFLMFMLFMYWRRAKRAEYEVVCMVAKYPDIVTDDMKRIAKAVENEDSF